MEILRNLESPFILWVQTDIHFLASTSYKPENRHVRQETWSEEAPDGRWRAYLREELLRRDKASLDVFWLKDAFMTDLDNLPELEVLADEIMENLRSVLASFEAVGEGSGTVDRYG